MVGPHLMLAHRAATQRACTPARVWPFHARRAWGHGRGSSLPCQCACSNEAMLAQWPAICIAAGPQAQATHTHAARGMAWHGLDACARVRAKPIAPAACQPTTALAALWLCQHPLGAALVLALAWMMGPHTMLAHRAAAIRRAHRPCRARRSWGHARGCHASVRAGSDEAVLAQWPGLCIAACPQAQATRTHAARLAWRGVARWPHALAWCVQSPLHQQPANLQLPLQRSGYASTRMGVA